MVARLLALLFAVALSFGVVGVAQAGKGSGPDDCTGLGDRCDQGEAYAALVAWIGRDGPARCAASGRPAGSGHRIVMTGGSNGSLTGTWAGDARCGDNAYVSMGFKYWGAACPVGTTWNPTTNTCFESCETRPDLTSGFQPPNGSIQCVNFCDVAWYSNGDGTSTRKHTGQQCDKPPSDPDCSRLGSGYYWNATLNVCSPVKLEDCDPGVTPKEGVCKKPDTCPAGMVMDENGACKPKESECPAGQTKGPDGSCVNKDDDCPAGQTKGADGTCKPDEDGDGTPDEEDDDPSNDPDKKSFSGGDDCNAPPSCSGDAILCGQAKIQWRIECNTRRQVNIAGGSCDAVPVCTGEKCNAMEYAQLLQQWRTSCAVQKLASTVGEGGINVVGGGAGGGSGDGNGNGIPDDAEEGVSEGEGTEPSVGEIDGGALWSKVDGAGWLGGGACPGLPPVELNGRTIDVSAKPCEQVALLGQLIVAAAMAAAAYIIGRAATGG